MLPIYYILLSNAINNPASMLRSLGVELVEAYSETRQISNMVLFAKVVNNFQAVTLFTKSHIFDV